MSLFRRNDKPSVVQVAPTSNQSALAELVLESINEGVVTMDNSGVIRSINPAAQRMLEVTDALGLDFRLIFKMELKDGRPIADAENLLYRAIMTSQPLEDYDCNIVAKQSGKRIPVSINVIIPSNENRVITFRNIAKELEEDNAEAEFISTASHEMRTPVASIEGYLSLALNPQTATIDDRARKYLDSAHAASKHLGKLFQDLLDTTKLDDGRLRPEMIPVEMLDLTKKLADNYAPQFAEAKIHYKFGAEQSASVGTQLTIQQAIYGYVDVTFLQEILNNLLENAKKYTPSGGAVWVNVTGEFDRIIISVKDTGIGISSNDLQHIFQKFYRADNTDTREIGGTGLGLYLVKQRVEAMGGKVWAESVVGSGSTFYVSLPRIPAEEFNRRMAIINNQKQFTNGGQQ